MWTKENSQGSQYNVRGKKAQASELDHSGY